MSLICPLCGKDKPKDSLFCDYCSKKINSDFEINIHEKEIPPEKDVLTSEKEELSEIDSKENNLTEKNLFEKDLSEKDLSPDYVPENNKSKELNVKRIESDAYNYPKKSKKTVVSLFWVLIAITVLIGAFLIYNKTILAKNLERRAWETAVSENSVGGYLDYIESHPDGIHFDDAQAGLMKLKEEEAITWEKLKVSVNLDELVNFSRQYENSPYIPLVRNRIDSLSWISALKMNSAESYSEYINNSRSGMLKGDYISEASERHAMLFQTFLVKSADIDSIRTTINGFFASLSTINHTGLYEYLAPEVYRFFDSGSYTRERITGELMMTAAQAGGRRFSFEPNLEGIKYEKETDGSYKVNVPVIKSYTENGSAVHLPGYIAHIEMNTNYEIRSIYESKPFPGSP